MRISKERYIMEIALTAAKRSSCPKSQVGSVFITEDFEVLGTGYNGAPKNLPHCLEIGCDKDQSGKCQRAIHSEMAAIIQAAKKGIRLENSILYVTRFPCRKCSFALINLGIKAVVVPENSKKSPEGFDTLSAAKITCLELKADDSIIRLS